MAGHRRHPGSAQLSGNAVAALFGLVGLAVVGLGYLAWWASGTYVVVGEVSGREWRHTVRREDWTGPTRIEDWAADLDARPMVPPRDGAGEDPGCDRVRDCHEKRHHTTRSCYGTGKSRHCWTKVHYWSWCACDTWVWSPESERVLSGTDDSPTWVELPTGPEQRLVREAAYGVTVAYGGESPRHTYELEPEAAPDFLRWRRGDAASVVIRNGGWVSEVHPLEGPE